MPGPEAEDCLAAGLRVSLAMCLTRLTGRATSLSIYFKEWIQVHMPRKRRTEARLAWVSVPLHMG